jgi:hypothetical protein
MCCWMGGRVAQDGRSVQWNVRSLLVARWKHLGKASDGQHVTRQCVTLQYVARQYVTRQYVTRRRLGTLHLGGLRSQPWGAWLALMAESAQYCQSGLLYAVGRGLRLKVQVLLKCALTRQLC